MVTIITKFINHGRYIVYVMEGLDEIGSFQTNDMQLIDDVQKMNDGFESELVMFDTFGEVIIFCKNRI